MALTAKQTAFINEYLIDLNATQAAIRAGYSEKTADRIGHENLKKLEIQQEIADRMKQREKKALITAEEVINGIRAIAFNDEAKHNDKLRAYELLGKHLALFEDRLKVEQNINVVSWDQLNNE